MTETTQIPGLPVMSGDGSHTLFSALSGEHYHSMFGAIQESKHIFIEAGLKVIAQKRNQISIFEVGFGTGLNAFLTCLYARECNIPIQYHSIEPFPLEKEVWSCLNYEQLLNPDNQLRLFDLICDSGWNRKLDITPTFSLYKNYSKLQDIEKEESSYDLVYFDAFSPEAQPELWTAEIFQQIFDLMKPGALLLTYCCKGEVKRNLKYVGFRIEKLPGPPGKREFLRAEKP